MKKLLFILLIFAGLSALGQNSSDTVGIVFLSFIVTETGELTEIRTLKGINENLNEIARSLLINSPKWKPRKDQGKSVKTRMVLPVIIVKNDSLDYSLDNRYYFWEGLETIGLEMVENLKVSERRSSVKIEILTIVKRYNNESGSIEFQILTGLDKAHTTISKNQENPDKLLNLMFNAAYVESKKLERKYSGNNLDQLEKLTAYYNSRLILVLNDIFISTKSGADLSRVDKWSKRISKKIQKITTN